jgi:GLPGLI family protein
MKKYLFLFCSLCCFNLIFAQKISKITYLYQDDMGFQCPSYLFVSPTDASFRINDPRTNGLFQPEIGASAFTGNALSESTNQAYYVDNDSISTFFYSISNKSISRFPFDDGKELLYEQVEKQASTWQLINESKQIQNYNCRKAQIKKNGRTFTVWYTLQIPISMGPLKLNGLPGLILEVEESEKYCKIVFQSMDLDSKDQSHFSIKKYVENKKIQSYEAYEKMMLKRIVGKKVNMVNELSKFKADQGLDSSGEIKITMSNNEFYSAILDLPKNVAAVLDSIKL